MEPMVILNVRIPPTLREQLDHVAIEERLSMQATVVGLLYHALDARKARKARPDPRRAAKKARRK